MGCITFGLESDLASHVVSLLASGLFSCGVRGLERWVWYPHLLFLPEICPGMAHAFVISTVLWG